MANMNPNMGDFDRQITHWINFRNSHTLVPVIVQSFMVLCAALIVLGLIYVVILVIAIAIHHFLFDRDPKKVPDYVKNSIQFSSESESDSDLEEKEEDEPEYSKTSYDTAARKMAALDKFLGSNQDDLRSEKA